VLSEALQQCIELCAENRPMGSDVASEDEEVDETNNDLMVDDDMKIWDDDAMGYVPKKTDVKKQCKNGVKNDVKNCVYNGVKNLRTPDLTHLCLICVAYQLGYLCRVFCDWDTRIKPLVVCILYI
jgi:hypothetical protein